MTVRTVRTVCSGGTVTGIVTWIIVVVKYVRLLVVSVARLFLSWWTAVTRRETSTIWRIAAAAVLFVFGFLRSTAVSTRDDNHRGGLGVSDTVSSAET